MKIKVDKASTEEVASMKLRFMDVNWGLWIDGELLGIFQAEEDSDGWLAVHANVMRHRVHPIITKKIAHSFATDLLKLGAVGLKAEIAVDNRAAIRMAKNAGFTEVHRNENWVTLRRENGSTETNPDAV